MTRPAPAGLLALGALSLIVLPLGARSMQPPPPLPALTPPPPVQIGSGRPAAQPAVPAPASVVPPASTATATSNREIVLELRKRTISLIEGDRVLGRWPVAIGDPTTPTPTGRFAVRNKVVNPQYQSTKTGKNNPTIGPNGPLGDRWIGFHSTSRDQFGIHGTPPAWAWAVQQGAAVTHGCVRMLGPHVRALFEQVDVGTPVVVKP